MSGHGREKTLGGRNYKQGDKLLVTSWETATCQVWWDLLLGDPSISQVPARSEYVQKLSFLLFPKEMLEKKKRHWKDCTYTWYLTKTPNVWAADCNLSNFEVLRGLPPTLILCLWLPTVKVFCSCPIITVLQQLVCNLSNSKTIPQKEVIKLKCKAIVLNYYVRDRKLRHRERLVCLTKDDFLDTPQYTRQVTDTKGPKGYPHIS